MPMGTDSVEWLIEHGFHVHACCPPNHHEIEIASNKKEPCPETSSGKVPYDIKRKCHLWKWEQAAPLMLMDFQRFSKMNPRPNVGLKLGDGLVRVDIDSEIGEEHIAKRNLPLPDSWEFTSGRGRGILYHVPVERTCCKRTIYEKVELLGDGQQTVIPSSIHRRGTPYEWKAGHAPTEMPLADAPEWIIAEMDVAERPATPSEGRPQRITALDDKALIECVLPYWTEGHRNDRALGLAAFLKKKLGCDQARTENIIRAICTEARDDEVNQRIGAAAATYNKEQVAYSGDARLGDELIEELYALINEPLVDGYKTPREYFEIYKIQKGAKAGQFEYHFKHAELANDIIKNAHILTLRDYADLMFSWDGCYYQRDAETRVKDTVKLVLGKLADKVTTRGHAELMFQIDLKTSASRKLFRSVPAYLVPVMNGILDTRTRTLIPPDPTIHYFDYQIAMPYDKEACCQKWEKFLADIHYSKDLPVVQEWWGYHFRRDQEHKKAFMGLGNGSNGKSIELFVLREILGAGNASAVPLAVMTEGGFAVENLVGKLANIAPDITSKALRDTSVWKAITGQDVVSCAVKYQQKRIEDYISAKLSYSCNRLPDVAEDDTDAFYDRWLKVDYPYKFVDNPTQSNEKLARSKTEIVAEVLDDRSGILNWMLDGLDRLNKQGHFSNEETLTSEIRRKTWNKSANTLKAFFDECVRMDPQGNILASDFYKAYLDWCTSENLAPQSSTKVGRTVESLGVVKGRTTTERVYRGISLKSDSEKQSKL
jgi:P4 family phage/plasmid primase-like protien